MRIGVLGINHKLANLKLRELLAQACQRRFSAGNFTHGQHHFILLSTCNRTEIYFCSDDLAATHTYLLNIFRHEVEEEFDQKLYSYFGKDCFFHLTRVTAGLDSAIVAETEIQGQVKNAYEVSAQFSQFPEELHYLFQKALKIGKKVRSTFLLNRGLPEIEHAIFNTGLHFFQNIDLARVLFVGISEINQKILHFFKSKNLHDVTICNRTKENAQDLVKAHQLHFLDWKHLCQWSDYDWIILGTKAPHHLISSQDLPSAALGEKLIIDLSVPRNVDPLVAKHPNITLLNIDQMNRMLTFRKQKLFHMLAQAEQHVADASERQTLLFLEKQRHRERLLAIGA